MDNAILIACSLLTVINTFFSMYALIELLSFKKSTHRIEYRPVPQPEFEEVDIPDTEEFSFATKEEKAINKRFVEQMDLEGI